MNKFKNDVIEDYLSILIKKGVEGTHQEVARKYNISENLLFEWLKLFCVDQGNSREEYHEEVDALKKENHILKSAIIRKEIQIEKLMTQSNKSKK